ncbi:MAG: HlyD family efflux transporter periplasmic adaptor subunit [Chitinispirillaceae bacterium]|nr:HlyD family efflux transporter periplasmic adaptor subunit [Chitinispirillaceae bacterium]
MKKISYMSYLISFLSTPILILLLIILFKEKATSVEGIIVSKKKIDVTVDIGGRVCASRIVSLSLPITRLVKKVYVSEGASVREGDTLIVLDNTEEKNILAQRINEEEITKINLEKLKTKEITIAEEKVNQTNILEALAKRKRDRYDTLYKEGSISQNDLDEIIKEYLLAKSQHIIAEKEVESIKNREIPLYVHFLEKAKLLREQAETALANTILRAPSDGKIVSIRVKKGELSSANSTLINFQPIETTMFIEAIVSKDKLDRINIGMPVSIKKTDDSYEFSALVVDIQKSGTSKEILKISPLNRDDLNAFSVDEVVKVKIHCGSIPNGLVIENRFIKMLDEKIFVFVKRGERAYRTEVDAIDIGNGRSLIICGLNEGDTIVTPDRIDDGWKVKVRRIVPKENNKKRA